VDRDSEVTHLEWCRAAIDHYCIFRSPAGNALLTSKLGGLNTWQFYMPIAVLDQQFAYRMAQMFWEYFEPKLPFQICACESGGVPLMSALQAQIPVSGFVIKKQAKVYGLKNWLEGIVDPEKPVLLVDDIIGGGNTLTAQANRLAEFGLTLHPEAFCIAACKKGGTKSIKVGEQEIAVKTFYGPDDFVRTYRGYVAKYGKEPQFQGTLV
jgi:orotate phosphoribosyltransferase